jgi:hypothetical protein
MNVCKNGGYVSTAYQHDGVYGRTSSRMKEVKGLVELGMRWGGEWDEMGMKRRKGWMTIGCSHVQTPQGAGAITPQKSHRGT